MYVDNDVSAFKSKVVRPEFERMLRDLENGVVAGCVVYDLDRFARQPADLERAITIFDGRAGLVFATVQGDIELSSPDGRTMARVMVAFANKSSMDASRRLTRKKLELAQRGEVDGTHRPFGYEDDRVTVRVEEADLIREAASDILSGISLHGIARRWNEAGVKTAYGNKWLQAPLLAMMVSPRLAGYRVHRGEIARTPDGDPVMAKRPPILDVQTWEALQALLRDPARTGNHTHDGGRKRLLAGMVRCGRCGKPMSGDKDHRRQVQTYACKIPTSNGGCGRIAVSGEPVDSLVTELVLAYLSGRDLQTDSDVGEWPGEDRLSDTVARISELMAAFTSGDLSKDLVFPAVQKLETKATQMRSERSAFVREQVMAVNRPANIAEVWPDLDVDQRRVIIESVLVAVVVKPAAVKGGRFSAERIEVVWRE